MTTIPQSNPFTPVVMFLMIMLLGSLLWIAYAYADIGKESVEVKINRNVERFYIEEKAHLLAIERLEREFEDGRNATDN